MKIAVLSVQGAFIEHEKMLSLLGVQSFEIRQKRDLEQEFDGLILPGGESTVMGKLLRELDLFDTLEKKIKEGLPVLGTCAFIRAPFVESAGADTEIIARVDGNIVGVKYHNQIGVSFHPEVTECTRLHEYFLRICQAHSKP